MTIVRSDKFLCSWPDCGKTYGKASKLEEHLRSHTNIRPFVCEQCGKTFLRNGHLRRHWTLSHSTEPKPFVCSYDGCGKVFGLRHHLRRHSIAHEESKPFTCTEEDCNVKFSRKEQLKKHRITAHSKTSATGIASTTSKTYTCGVDGCTALFTKWSLIVQHRKRDHATIMALPCPECGKVFEKTRNLKSHIDRVHCQLRTIQSIPCWWPDCEKAFSSKNAVKVHIATVHEKKKPYYCEVCERCFGHKHLLARHRRVHQMSMPCQSEEKKDDSIESSELLDQLVGVTTERIFECPVSHCRRLFLRDYDRRRHIESIHSDGTSNKMITSIIRDRLVLDTNLEINNHHASSNLLKVSE